MLYAFILGKNTALSIAEIFSVLKRELFVCVSFSITSKALIIKLDKRIENPQNFLDKLGGTIKIAEILEETSQKNLEESLLNYISNNFSFSKFVFGISTYDTNFSKLGFEIKKRLKKMNINSRFVMGKEKGLSAPEIKNNKILTHGADFILIPYKNMVLIGRTIAIQNYEFYSHRDYDRPRRNAKSGMLPPKIAQIMLNLIPYLKDLKNPNNPKDPTIYDPFCGQGTILQEALLTGYEAIGSDISKDRVYDTKENLKWLKDKYGLVIEPEKIVFQSDALKLDKVNIPEKINTIVSEVYLGPPLTEKVTQKVILIIIDDLEKKYSAFLKNIQLIPNIQYLVLAIPFFNLKNQIYYLNIFDNAQKISYNVLNPFNGLKIDLNLVPDFNTKRKTILYSRPNQIVGREIIILERYGT